MECQSCGLPLRKDPKKGGTNVDGSKSITYCSLCYEGGHFKDSCADGREMRKYVRKRMRAAGHNPIAAWLQTFDIPHLDRWRQE